MARKNRKTELLSHLRTAELIIAETASPASTTLGAAPAAGATSLTVAAITGFGVGNTIAVGSGERKEIVKVHASTAPASTTITLDATTPLQYDHDIGDPVVLQQVVNLGAVHSDGVAMSYDGDPTDVNAENQSFLYAQKTGFAEITFDFGLLGVIPENICAALGLLLAGITGAGTTSSPRELYIDLTDDDGVIGEQGDSCWRFTGVRKDRTVVQYDAFACELDPSAFSLDLGRTAATKVPVRLKVTGGVLARTSL